MRQGRLTFWATLGAGAEGSTGVDGTAAAPGATAAPAFALSAACFADSPFACGLRQVNETRLVCCLALCSLLECPTMPQMTSNLKFKVQAPARGS